MKNKALIVVLLIAVALLVGTIVRGTGGGI